MNRLEGKKEGSAKRRRVWSTEVQTTKQLVDRADCFRRQQLVLEALERGSMGVSGGGEATADWRGLTLTTMQRRSTLHSTRAARALTVILRLQRSPGGAGVRTDQVGASLPGGEQHLGLPAVPHWRGLSHGRRPLSCFHNHLREKKHKVKKKSR